jgi:nucleotide-binding universal stress UspA family protein
MSYRSILVAFDGSKASEKALQQAVELAASHPEAKLTVVHVMQMPMLDFGSFTFGPPEGYLEEYRNYEDMLREKARQQTASLPNAEFALLSGSPAKAILQYVQVNPCDLIVMGSRGLGAIQEWMLGSVSHQVVHQAQVPVLIVK